MQIELLEDGFARDVPSLSLKHLLSDARAFDQLFAKVLTKNDDSGRHGVLIPVSAYGMFPDFPAFDRQADLNYTAKITTQWNEGQPESRASCFKHYHRYPERRMTALGSKRLNEAPPNSIFIAARFRDRQNEFECIVLALVQI
jgi:hypothetical protein